MITQTVRSCISLPTGDEGVEVVCSRNPAEHQTIKTSGGQYAYTGHIQNMMEKMSHIANHSQEMSVVKNCDLKQIDRVIQSIISVEYLYD